MKVTLALAVVLFSFAAAAQKPQPVPVADVAVPVTLNEKANTCSGTVYYGFQKGDKIQLSVLNEKDKGTFQITLSDHSSGTRLYAASGLKKLKDAEVVIPKKAVYQITLTSETGKPQELRLQVQRTPANPLDQHFNTTVSWQTRPDTSWTSVTEKVLVKREVVPQTIVDKTFRVHSRTKIGNENKTVVPFKLPANTLYWVYWLGVGQESVQELANLTDKLAKGSAAVVAPYSPVVAFGLGMLPSLPQVKASGNIDYFFLNKEWSEQFMANEDFKFYPFATGKSIISDYQRLSMGTMPKTSDGKLYAGFRNNNTLTGLDVTLKIVAFEEVDTYETRTTRKPKQVQLVQVPVFGD
ncbi:MAG: hypothetical protein LPJ89_10295 [Hymenobacteraceae bacterium]|nr:hypothetical protein [Hymenobacteraceae bacterium]MDX5396374.1 hypothetical protein [Hymenobacteraceae bacterium]MDX5444158.1 hypothetical protein [Hymenobacteraceae bacterium]MDX5512436.1 hypothetical protein [Hymenobacteraceae bacterium]